MIKNKLFIIGAGGHGKVAAECAESMGAYNEIVFLDVICIQQNKVGPWAIVGPPESFGQYVSPDTEFFVAIGDNHIRRKWFNELLNSDARIATLIHASATVSEYAELGQGSMLSAHAVINPFSTIGIGSIVNTGATLDHDCVVESFVHIAPGCHIAGIVKIGELSFIGIGCTVVQSVSIGKNCVLGAGSVVIRNIQENSFGYGVPVKIIKTLE